MTVSTLWIEIDDLARYFDGSVTPTGIARVQAEIIPRLLALAPGRVRLLRLGSGPGRMTLYEPGDLAWLAGRGPFAGLALRPGWTGLAGRALRLLWREARHVAAKARSAPAPGRFARAVRPGDVILNLGASWSHPGFPDTLRQLALRYRIKVAVLVHDVIPLSHPQFANRERIEEFRVWFEAMAGVWDRVLTPSRHTADMVQAQLAAMGQRVPPITTIRFGAGFSAAAPGPAPPLGERRHVLYVSTIERRKNHALLIDVWQRLLSRHGPSRVPDLVLAGKWGWQIGEIVQTLKATANLDGKVRIVPGLSDEALAALYRGARYTAFPSFCEGWGLPVGESLAHGRHCIAAAATAIPEAGGGMIELHDPASVEEALALHERAILDDAHIAACEARIRTEWQRPDWDATARAVLAAVGTGTG